MRSRLSDLVPALFAAVAAVVALAVAVAALFTAAPALAQRCVEDTFCLSVVESGESSDLLDVVVDNQSDTDLIIVLDFTTENLVSSIPLPHLDRYPAGRETIAFQFRVEDPSASWSYASHTPWRLAVEDLGCQQESFCLEAEVTREGVDLFVDNLRPWDLTLGVQMQVDANAVVLPEPASPANFPAGERTLAARLQRIDATALIRYQFGTRYAPGRFEAVADDYVYALPYAPGESFRVGQGPYTTGSHQGVYAVDWNMPEGTPVHAARGGLVIEVEESYREGGTEERFKNRANKVHVYHDDGTVGRYIHLAPEGVLVEVGDRVERGQKIALSGHTGYSSGPHLHFDVSTRTADWGHRTFPLRFELSRNREGELEQGRSYRVPRE